MPGKRPYHHGNLRETLLAAALEVIAEAGPQAFTLREMARRAGVSHNAPYRHFHDKNELLAAVAAQGFEKLTATMKRAAARGLTATDRLRLCGRGYVDFAQRWPQHFLVMFDLPVNGAEYPEYAAAGTQAFQTLLDSILQCQEAGALPPGDPSPMALASWSMVHGVAKLAIGRRLPFSAAGVLDFTNYLADVLMHGMAQPPGIRTQLPGGEPPQSPRG